MFSTIVIIIANTNTIIIIFRQILQIFLITVTTSDDVIYHLITVYFTNISFNYCYCYCNCRCVLVTTICSVYLFEYNDGMTITSSTFTDCSANKFGGG